jgi:hypothetical protein
MPMVDRAGGGAEASTELGKGTGGGGQFTPGCFEVDRSGRRQATQI